ncbi:MAG: 1-deoxy-D-xylulose-5-phosphate reductoisomerase, partial [Clostridia bacterium]|nr:1-deoxy-D-xylulose-5-phosphate reductoisomerase [Clostridia bacterium]
GHLDFAAPDFDRFPALKMAIDALKAGGSTPVIMNGANEAAVGAFLKGQIPFGRIPELIREALTAIPVTPITCIADVYEADGKARAFASERIKL